MADADKPIARLRIDTRAYGPLICENCEEINEDDAEQENALLMEDGGVVCEKCHTPFEAFDQFSGIITSVEPVKVRGGGRKGYEIAEENPRDFRDAPNYRGCSIHSDDVDECKADPEACRWTCDVHDQECVTPTSRHYADTKSFMCDEARNQFLKDYRWDDKRGEWVERS